MTLPTMSCDREYFKTPLYALLCRSAEYFMWLVYERMMDRRSRYIVSTDLTALQVSCHVPADTKVALF
ncbi:hypothetical protein BCR44DRAFT_1444438 [Catenaria anguillulae PL171]|uniref:Uncharacterized protein n=1 Tax=Catenaria anguillulae PL171 TaxID=765915 RepID=A0A1Y2H7R5_9FUNG|nr:hypothetical protein BCR44DRAFT_1444438 [Catenaria anguillulae PL171]